MPVDFGKKAHILAVHGVQVGKDKNVKSVDSVRKLVTKSLERSHLNREFEVPDFFYEDINDNAQKFYKLIAGAIADGNPLVKQGLKMAIDLVGDVVTAAHDTSTAHEIRGLLKDKIMESYDGGHQLVVVAHSLGTVYTLDAISELMQRGDLFQGDDRTTWPVQGYISMGSPLGLEIEVLGTTIFDKRNVAPVAGANFEVFPWHNYYNRLDPVVSGNVFGAPVEIKGSKGPVEQRYGGNTMDNDWLLHGHIVTSGKQWLLAHTTYWKNPKIGDRVVDMLWG